MKNYPSCKELIVCTISVSEPAILVMYYSMRSHPAITATLLDFLCRVSVIYLQYQAYN